MNRKMIKINNTATGFLKWSKLNIGMVGNEAQRAEGILTSTAKNIFIGLLIL
jgi:hypothetical protein